MTPETRARLKRAVAKVAKHGAAIAERNSAIREARREGATLADIADEAKITRMAVHKILNKENPK